MNDTETIAGEMIDDLREELRIATENWRALQGVVQMYLDKIIETEKEKLRLKEENAQLRDGFINIRDKLEKLEKQSCH